MDQNRVMRLRMCPSIRRPRVRASALAAAIAFVVGPAHAEAPLSPAVPLMGAGPASGASEPRDIEAPLVSAVACVGMTVSDLDRAVEWYSSVLTFENVAESEHAGEAIERLTGVFGCRVRIARLRLGDEFVELTQYLAPEGRPIPVDSRSHDGWFQHIAIVTPDMERAYAHLRTYRVRHASSGPQRLPDWNPLAGGIEAFYFKDPDGHVLEVIRFPEGKGDPKWRDAARSSPDRLFLGVDHTAIVVRDTERSIAFYRGVLGLRVAGASENFGTEQEHLNNVFGARLRITSLRAQHGPGIELLEYLAPGDGRPFPSDARPNDLMHWQITLAAPDAGVLDPRHPESSAPPGRPIDARDVRGAFGLRAGRMIRDPDGHAVLVGFER